MHNNHIQLSRYENTNGPELRVYCYAQNDNILNNFNLFSQNKSCQIYKNSSLWLNLKNINLPYSDKMKTQKSFSKLTVFVLKKWQRLLKISVFLLHFVTKESLHFLNTREIADILTPNIATLCEKMSTPSQT
jgi:hypothetical protein